MVELADKMIKALVFVEHIEEHLKDLEGFEHEPKPKVICKICGKDIDEIYAHERSEGKAVGS